MMTIIYRYSRRRRGLLVLVGVIHSPGRARATTIERNERRPDREDARQAGVVDCRELIST